MNGATGFHAQTTVPVPIEKRVAGADFMLGLSFAQAIDNIAGPLDAAGRGADRPTWRPSRTRLSAASTSTTPGATRAGTAQGQPACSMQNRQREQIARGQGLFNDMQFQVSGVAGLNDELGIPVLTTTCNGCHRAKNVGSSTSVRFMDIGVADESNRPEFLPLLTVRTGAPARSGRRRTSAARSTPACGRTSARSACSACAVSRRARRISTPVRPRPSIRSSTSTTTALPSGSATNRRANLRTFLLAL